jgi:hypothetical protein
MAATVRAVRMAGLPDHQPMFEAWNGEPFAHGHEHFELRVQLAVVDAATAP